LGRGFAQNLSESFTCAIPKSRSSMSSLGAPVMVETLVTAMRRRRRMTVALFGLAGYEHGVLKPAGPVGEDERLTLLGALAIMLAIVVPTILCSSLLPGGTAPQTLVLPTRRTGRTQAASSSSCAALVVLFVGSIAWISSLELDPAKPLSSKVKALEVQ